MNFRLDGRNSWIVIITTTAFVGCACGLRILTMPLRFRYFILLIMWNFVFVCCCNSCSVFFLLTSCTGWCWWFDVGYTSSWWLTFIHGILCFKLFMQHIFINYLILINSSKFKRCLYNSIETNLKNSPLKRPSRLSGFNTPCQLNTKRLHGFCIYPRW